MSAYQAAKEKNKEKSKSSIFNGSIHSLVFILEETQFSPSSVHYEHCCGPLYWLSSLLTLY